MRKTGVYFPWWLALRMSAAWKDNEIIIYQLTLFYWGALKIKTLGKLSKLKSGETCQDVNKGPKTTEAGEFQGKTLWRWELHPKHNPTNLITKDCID